MYKMTNNIQKNRDERACRKWFVHDKRRKSISSFMECPCDSGLLRFDPRYEVNRFDSENRLLCYASLLSGDNVVRFHIDKLCLLHIIFCLDVHLM